mgnify:CR=1 FL=1
MLDICKQYHAARTIVAILFMLLFIACLGLFGLASFMREQRSREALERFRAGRRDAVLSQPDPARA